MAAPVAYDKFDKRIGGFTRVALKPQMTGGVKTLN